MDHTFVTSKKKVRFLHPPPFLSVCPNGSELGEAPRPWTSKLRLPTTPRTLSRTRNQSGTFIAEPDTCLEHCLYSNNTYTNYSCGHPISVNLLPITSPSVTIHFRLNFDHCLPDPVPPTPLPLSIGCHKCMAPNKRVSTIKKKKLN